MKINGLIKKARWESIPCECGTDIINSFPIKDCLHCKFDQCWKSVPQDNFKVNDDIIDKNGKVTKKQTKTVKEITLVRGTFEDVVGWKW
jgi:hypothetical protein